MDRSGSEGAVGAAEVLLGAGVDAAERAWRAARPLRAVGGGLLRGAWTLTARVVPGPVLAALAERGDAVHADLAELVDAALRLAVRRVVEALIASVDLTALVREHVDLDEVAAGLDVEAVIARVDLDAVVAGVDLDTAVARVDLDAVARRLDLDGLVATVDLDAAAARLDLDGLVATVDIDAVAARLDLDAVAARLDLDAVAARLDPDPVVARVDLEAAIARVDLAGIAREVIDEIGLPDIVRDSTGTMASDAVRSVRAEGRHADDAVSGLVDRVLRRSRPGAPAVP